MKDKVRNIILSAVAALMAVAAPEAEAELSGDVVSLAERAQAGDALAQNELGLHYATMRDYAEAARWFRAAAEQGDVNAAWNLGNCYYNGNGVEQNPAEAVRLWTIVAEQGDAAAQVTVAECYRDGDGVAVDYAAMAGWYAKAAEQGDAYAQTELGRCYLEGRGVARDREKAAEWYGRAAAAGYEPAVEALRELAQ